MQIGARIYYDKATGNVIANTGDRAGSVVETTVEQDFDAYAALAERVPETVEMMQLAYEQRKQDFRECNGYRVDITTAPPSIVFSYPDPNAPEAPPVYQPPLTEQVETLKKRLAATEQTAADSSLNTQQLIETLIDLGVI